MALFSGFTAQLAVRMWEARTRSGKSQQDVATAIKVTAKTIANWEKGLVRVYAEDLVRFAKACGTTVAALTEGL